MTDTARTDAPGIRTPIPLEPFEGRDVIGSKIKITKAGDGLSDALSVEPQAFHHGDVVYVVLRCMVAKVQHTEVKDTGALSREHSFEAQDAVIVDEALVKDVVEQQRILVREAKEKAAGIMPLPLGQDEDPETGGPAVEALEQLKKSQLWDLANANSVAAPAKATSARLIELLKDVPGIEDAAKSYVTVPDLTDEDATVTDIGDRL